MIYLVGCSKGGVGKTTMALNIAVHLALQKRRVCLVDADEQLHLNAWATNRLSLAPDAPRIDCRVMAGKIKGALEALARDYDDVVVDAAGKDSSELRSGLRAAHVVIMPFAAGQFELYAVEKMDELITQAREEYDNPGLKALAFINKAETNWVRSKTARAALEFIDQFPSMRRAETLVHLRSAPFNACADTGLSVFELGRGADKAATEVANLMQEATDLMEGRDGVHAQTEDDADAVGGAGVPRGPRFEA
jgi:chromosome partitioning protein